MTHSVNGDLNCWRVPQSPVQILYSRLVPRGGLEIGGVLLGKYRDSQVEVTDFEPLECEHAFGPSFSLSSRDEERLKDLLAEVRNKSGGLEPVGWYHSHTRSEIFLTEADLEIHNRYFPEMWEVALVVRPSTSEPARAGFFFREIGGSIHASASYHEFELEPLRDRRSLLRAEADVRALLKAADPVALPPPESKPQPVIGSLPLAPLGSPSASTPNSGLPLECALTPAADPQPPARFLAPAADARLTLDSQSSLRPGAKPVPLRERPLPLSPHPQPAAVRQPAPTGNAQPPLDLTPTFVFRPALESPAALAADPQPKLEHRVTPVADAAPLAKRPGATTPDPRASLKPLVVSTMTTRVDCGSQLIELPRFLRNEPSPQSELTRVPVFIIGMVCGAVALGGLAFVARDAVLPLIGGLAGRVSTSRERAPTPKSARL
jgi:proteasome lid subunit RPN8/RPN11